MVRRVLASGFFGCLILLIWTLVLNAGFGFSQRVQMRSVTNERDVYTVLKESITEPGVYLLNPAADPRVGYPPGEPVFAVQYGGIGHEAAGGLFLIELAVGLAAAMLASVLLSMAATRVLSSYLRKVVFVGTIGLLIALLCDLQRFGIGGYPLDAALLLAARDLIGWLLAGLVMARFMRPAAQPAGLQG